MGLINQIFTTEKIIFPIFILLTLFVAFFFGEKVWRYFVFAFFMITRVFTTKIFFSMQFLPNNIIFFLILTFLEFFLILFSLTIGLRLREKKWRKKYILNSFICSVLGTAIIGVATLIISEVGKKIG